MIKHFVYLEVFPTCDFVNQIKHAAFESTVVLNRNITTILCSHDLIVNPSYFHLYKCPFPEFNEL